MSPSVSPTPTSLTQALTPQNIMQPITDWLGGTVPSLPKALLFVIIGVIAIRIISKVLVNVLGVTRLPKATIKVTVKLVDIVLWMLLVIAFLQLAGLSNVAFAISGAFAILALAFSNGFSATVGDTIAGINLSRDRHFRIGDLVRVGAEHNIEGIIIDMDVRKTRLKDDQGHIYVVPNSVVDKNTFVLIERHAGQPPADTSKPLTSVRSTTRNLASKTGTMRTKKG